MRGRGFFSNLASKVKNFFVPKPHELSLRESITHSNKGVFHNIQDRISAFAHGRYNAPPGFIDFLKKYGGYIIQSVVVCRKPVQSVIQGVLNAVSFGRFEREKKKLGYDDMYHLYLQLTIVNPANPQHRVQVTAEKNHVVQVHTSHSSCPQSVTVSVPSGKTVFDLFDRASDLQGNAFWQYDPISNNCQVFAKTVLEANGMLNPNAESFILQPAKSLLSSEAQKFASSVTDLAGRLDALVLGAGLHWRKHNWRG